MNFSLYLLWAISVRYYCTTIYHNLFCFGLSWLHKRLRVYPWEKINYIYKWITVPSEKEYLGYQMYTIQTIHYFRDKFKYQTWPNWSTLHWGYFYCSAIHIAHHRVFQSQRWCGFHSWHCSPLSLKK